MVFDKVVEIKVFNAKNIITTALIGTFKVTAYYSSMNRSFLACLCVSFQLFTKYVPFLSTPAC